MSGYFLPSADIPTNFVYPELFHKIVGLGLVDWTPWRLMSDDQLLWRRAGVSERYPKRNLVPFARRVDRDDIACWDLDEGDGKISIIDDFDAPGLEQLRLLDSFEQWLRIAFEDMLAWED